jgi:ABC-type nitrate/sulfonate/bicarbonate transport system substrate-binding protein
VSSSGLNTEHRARRVIGAVIVWCVILCALGATYKFVIRPLFAHREPGTSDPRYERAVNVALDSFSGYCILRSPAVLDQLKAKRIKLNFEDDKADYEGRMKALKSGKVQMAVFTIDSFLVSGAKLGQFPASILLVLDETTGADAIVAYKDAIGSIRDLDSPAARFVLTPNSPSEFLARTVIAQFSLPSLPEKWSIAADGASKVYQEFRSARKTDKYAYVMWEPFVSKALEEPGAHVLIDSSKLKGYIVDVLVAERKFLSEQPQVVAEIIDAYLRAVYSYTSRQDGLLQLVVEDAKAYGDSPLKKADAEKVASGIQWKTTIANYAHFGLLPQAEMGGLQHIEDIITNITGVLVKTGAVPADPMGGKPNTIYYDKVLRDLKARDFHPGKKLDIIKGVGPEPDDLGTIQEAAALPALTDEQWGRLAPVGELRIAPVSFGRGTAQINIQSQRDLDELAKRLASFPQYYVVVTGNVRAEGDVEANRQLARDRADAVAKTLVGLKLHPNRIRSIAAEPSEKGTSAQSVSFLVGTVPF